MFSKYGTRSTQTPPRSGPTPLSKKTCLRISSAAWPTLFSERSGLLASGKATTMTIWKQLRKTARNINQEIVICFQTLVSVRTYTATRSIQASSANRRSARPVIVVSTGLTRHTSAAPTGLSSSMPLVLGILNLRRLLIANRRVDHDDQYSRRQAGFRPRRRRDSSFLQLPRLCFATRSHYAADPGSAFVGHSGLPCLVRALRGVRGAISGHFTRTARSFRASL
nr:DoxC [Pseudomonas sp.]